MTSEVVSDKASRASTLDVVAAAACLFLVMVFGAGCGHEVSARLPEETQLKVSTISKGTRSGINQPLLTTAKDAAGWARLWARHNSVLVPAPTPPEVDFSREMVVAAFMGEKRTGGYDIEIVGAARSADALNILFTERAPAPGQMVIQMLTQPYHVAKVARTDLPVRFVRWQPKGAVRPGTVSQ